MIMERQNIQRTVAILVCILFVWAGRADAGNAQVASGYMHTLVIKDEGSLWAWGRNTFGQLGDGTTTDRYIPVQIGSDTDWQSIAAGATHSIAVKSDGSLWAWGLNDYGELGDGTTTDRYSPVQIGSDTDWQSVAAGGVLCLGLKSNGSLWAWGNGWEWVEVDMGNGAYHITRKGIATIPVQLGTDTDWCSVTTGMHTLGIKNDGSLWAWEYDEGLSMADGYLGLGKGLGRMGVPTILSQIGSDTDWQSIAAGAYHSLAVKSDGSLWAWGYNDYDQLGDGTTTVSSIPVQIGSDMDWQGIAAGLEYSLAVKSDGSLWAWGWIYYSQLGDDTTTVSSIPVQIGSDTDWQGVAAGLEHSLAVKSDGSLWAWGGNLYGQLGDGTTTDRYSPVPIALNGRGSNNAFMIPVNFLLLRQKP